VVPGPVESREAAALAQSEGHRVNDMARTIRDLERHGLVFVRGRKHSKIRDPKTGRAVAVSGTPSDRNAHRNVLRDVRKYLGVALTP
jgi:DNA-binding MarR family transcriptional regulator